MSDERQRGTCEDNSDREATYKILAACLEMKRAEAKAAECFIDEVRQEYEESVSYRIGKLLCRNSR